MTPPPSHQAKILFVDDEQNILNALTRLVRNLDATCYFTESGAAGLKILEQEAIDIVVSDMKMPEMSGVEFLSQVATQYPETIRFVLTGHADNELVMGAINQGKVYGYLKKPWVNEELLDQLEKAMHVRELLLERLLLQRSLAKYEKFNKHEFHGFIGDSTEMQIVYNTIEMAGPTNASVFITGASGTGKEVAATAIHACSKRKKRAFIAINCAAIPKDLIESEIFGHTKGAFSGAFQHRDGAATLADGGTLFLDELAEMDISLQSKLLRFIQTGTFQKVGSSQLEKVDIRFICATNKNPIQAIEKGEFREDLFYRLNVISLDIPDLSERAWDVVTLAEHFLQLYADEENKVFNAFTNDAEKLLYHYHWPGNVRQLQNTINSAVILSAGPIVSALELARILKLDESLVSDLLAKPIPFSERLVTTPERPVESSTSDGLANEQPMLSSSSATAGLELKALSDMERDIIELAIAQNDGNVVSAAKQLEVSPSTLYRKIQAWAPN